jgi:hypothetical protein
MAIRTRKHGISQLLSEEGFTLLEVVIASMVTASTLIIIMMFSMRSFEIASEINTLNDINHSFSRVQRSFVRDAQMAQYFSFGADIDSHNNQILNEFIDRRVLTVGYDRDGEIIWSRYAVKVGAETGIYYLLKTTNELEGDVIYETTILASDVDDVFFTYYNAKDQEITKAEDVNRIEMTIVLSDGSITKQMAFSATLRGENKGIAQPNKNLEIQQDTNFVK